MIFTQQQLENLPYKNIISGFAMLRMQLQEPEKYPKNHVPL